MGFPQIGYQTFKLLAYQRLHELARRWEERYPGVDIILIEPEPNDELMFQTSIMNYTSRVDIARHGFQSVTLKLAHDYPRFKRICARHGIDISATRVRKVVKHFEAERETTRAWRKILEQTTSTLLRQSARAALTGGPCASARLSAGAMRLRPWRPARRACGAAGDIASGSSRRLERKRVLSIRPLKIGTPNSTHLTITSRRSNPDSRASSVGVR